MPSLADFAAAEHCVLEDVTLQQPALDPTLIGTRAVAQDMRDEAVIHDKLRGRRTTVRIYAEGFADIEVERRGRQSTHHRIDLRYLDPIPTTRRHHPKQLLKSAGIAAAVTAVCSIPVWFGWILSYSIPATIIGATATLSSLFLTFYLSHEKITFKTLHGRADAIRFGAGLGTIRRFHKLIPLFVEAIADAAESVNDDTSIYLRAEMREHYRLRGDGILSADECAASTERILSEFDGPL
jgi:hypothetical protein